MSAMLALALAATTIAPAASDVTARTAPLMRSAQIIAARSAAPPVTTPFAAARRRGDSVKDGAIIGAVLAGSAMALFASRMCRDTSCAPDALLWTGIAAGLGGAAGAGIDAVFDQQPAARARIRIRFYHGGHDTAPPWISLRPRRRCRRPRPFVARTGARTTHDSIRPAWQTDRAFRPA